MRYGMVINLNKCVGCYGCVVKCKQEHFLTPYMTWAKILVSETGKYPASTKHMYPVLCNHCKEPACIDACPTGATKKRDDGIVLVDQEKCIGCKHCITACPYQIRTLYVNRMDYFPNQGPTDYEKLAEKLYPLKNDVVVKCNFCVENIDHGISKGLKPGIDREATPVCVNICPAKAREFGDLDDPSSNVSKLIRENGALQLHPGFGTEPSVFYILSPLMKKDRFISRNIFPASSKYSLPYFLMTAKKVRKALTDISNPDNKE